MNVSSEFSKPPPLPPSAAAVFRLQGEEGTHPSHRITAVPVSFTHMPQKALTKKKSTASNAVKRKAAPTSQKRKFRRDPQGTKLLHQSIEQKAAAKAMRNEGARFHFDDLNTRARSRLDAEEVEMARKKEKKRTAVDGAVASLEHAISGKRLKT